MRLALVMVKEYPGRPVKLTYDNPLSPVDNECTLFGHERDGAKIDFLFLNVPNILNSGLSVCLIDYKPNRNTNRDLIGHPFVDTIVLIILDLSKAIRNKP